MTTCYFRARNLKFAGFLLIMLFGLSMSAQITRYVKQGGNGNGYSWETASGSLQSMIDQADSGWQIYVAAGTYQQGTGQSFSMKSGVKIYGGFPATGSPGMADRNPALNPTILQGNGNRVLMNMNVDTAARLDGFTIQGGVTSGAESGAGIYNFSSSPKIVGCIIRNNTSGNWGGGIYSHYGYATFTNCLIYGNTAGGGGAAFEHEAQSTYTNCTITANTSLQNGGAMHTHENGTLTITNSIVWDNNAAAQGDEFYTTGSSTIVLIFSIAANEPGDTFGNITPSGNTSYTNPMFADAANNNFAPVYGSPAVNTGNSSYINGYSTDLAGNTRISLGTVDKGAYEFQATIRYVKQNGTGNGFSWNDASGDLQAMINASEGKVWVAAGTYTPATGASFTMKEGIKIYGGFPTTGNPGMGERNFAANVTILQGNGTRVVNNDNNGLSNAAVLDGFTITGGNAPNYGGGLSNVDVSPLIANCIFRNNSASYGGGGISNDGDYCAPTVKNCLIYSNTSQHGGATYDFDSKTNYINATISGNYATSDGGGMVTLWNANITVTNSILWGNSAGVTGHQASFTGATEVLRNTIVNNGYQHMYGNFTAINVGINDPMFVDAANFNFRLKGTSPAKQAGDTAQFPDAANSFDLDNNARLIGGVIDIGAYERAAPVYGNTLYVKQGSAGEGTSWDDPSPSLQAMIDAATSGKQVWVAAGTYTPASGQSFSMKQGVAIYGGFPATGSPGMAERNYKANVTILYGNGSRVINNTNNGLTNLAILDGFTVRNGNVTGNGAGMNNVSSYPLVANCIFNNNTASNWGGAVYNEGAGSSRFVNCLFYNCSANGGGAVFENSFSATNYRNCTFSKNNSTGNGGAIHTYQGGIAYLYSSIVWGNTCSGSGKQLYSVSEGQVIGSYADVAAGANDITGYYYGDNSLSSNPLFTAAGLNNFTLTAASPARDTGNSSHAVGYTSDLAGNPRISGFSADMGSFEYQSSAPVIRYVRQGGTGNGSSWSQASGNLYYMVLQTQAGQSVWIAEGTYGVAGGLDITADISIFGGFPPTGNPGMNDRNWGTYATVIDGAGGQAIRYSGTQNAILDGVTVSGGGSYGGGAIYNSNASPRINNCIFRGNTTLSFGGAIYNINSSPIITNTLFTDNISGSGGAIYSQGSSHPQLINVTLTGNHAGQRGGAIYNESGANATLKNSIIWGNTADNSGYQMYAADTNITAVNCILLTDTDNVGPYFTGENIISSDPLFSGDNDYSVVPCSPAVNAGNNALLTDAATAKDLAGNTRAFGTIDMGAYEVQSITAVPTPTASSPQEHAADATIASLIASGVNLQWYTASEGGSALDPATALNAGTYYVSQTVGGCESERTAVVVTVTSVPSSIRYVRPWASGTGDGSSWSNASNDIQLMINELPEGQIWVAAGSYQRGYYSSFNMKTGVTIYGGFPTDGSPGMADRDLIEHETTLVGNNASVVTAVGVSNALLDGFTITGGLSNGDGGGIIVYYSAMSFENLIVKNNSASKGGGIMLEGSASSLKNISLLQNLASFYGGGIGIANSTGVNYLENMIIQDNESYYFGGGLAPNENANVVVKNALITGNTAQLGGGLAVYPSFTSRFTNITVANNTAYYGSAAYLQNSGSTTIQNSILSGDILVYDSQVNTSNSMIYGSINGNMATNGGNLYAVPQFVNPSSGNYSLQAGSPGIDSGDTALFEDAGTATDLAGSQRVYGSGIDMGAYELKPDCGTIATTWNGFQWSDGVPVSYEYSASINGNFNSAEDGSITACSLTVYVGDVIIAEGDNFTIKGVVTVDNDNATFTIQHNANLIQIDDVDNIGTINVIKESAPMYRLDYALWASPVAGQKLKAFSPQTLDNRFYNYNPLSDAYATIQAPATTDFAEGKSYLIRVSNTHPAYVSDAIAPTRWEGTFIGVPNNGNVDVPVTGMANGINGYNGIGNPYPSSINIAAFFEANQNNLAEDSPIYFWRKKNDAGTSSYASLTLAGYNQNSGNAFGDSSNGVFDNPNDSENWVINPGQGFIVQATGNTVTFNNEMRVAVNNGQMFRSAMDASDKSRLWLNLTNSNGAFGQATIAYTPFTTLGRDFGWDGKALTDGEIAIYSLAGENKFGIQARSAFDAADEVTIEYKITVAGNYTISLDHIDGVFAEGQEIYLRDNVLGVTHNLQIPYQFTTEAGIITGRFDVVYAEALDTEIPTFNSNSIIVYKQGSTINISSGNVNMKSVAVYDIRGRLLYSANDINSATTSITNLQAQEQMLIVEVITVEGVKAGRKIVF